MKMPNAARSGGFTLIEIAVALVVVALVLGSILVPLTTQVQQRKIGDTQKALQEIKDALTGFAIINGRLPCPDTDTDPTAAGYGIEETSCSATVAAEGYLPWKTLGVTDLDAFGIRRANASSPRIGDWRYRVDRNFAVAFSLTTGFSTDSLSIVDSAGNALTATTERPIAIVFSAGPNTTPDGQNASYEGTIGIYQSDVQGDVPSLTFDDILTWVSRPTLFNRMTAAGKLP
jgi:prepilin-type N-terminal cleavage/methylation domain-containing protein